MQAIPSRAWVARSVSCAKGFGVRDGTAVWVQNLTIVDVGVCGGGTGVELVEALGEPLDHLPHFVQPLGPVMLLTPCQTHPYRIDQELFQIRAALVGPSLELVLYLWEVRPGRGGGRGGAGGGGVACGGGAGAKR